MTLEVKIRDCEKGDETFLMRWIQHPSCRDFYISNNPLEALNEVAHWICTASYKGCLVATIQIENVVTPVGMVVLNVIPFQKVKHHGEVSIIVDPEFHRQGIGSVMMNELFKMAKKRFGLEFLYLRIYGNSMDFLYSSVINFYKKFGFKKYATQKNCIKNPETGKYSDCIFLEKYL
jgi:ribosomal protein S18 acetylase RimI-like enzyme